MRRSNEEQGRSGSARPDDIGYETMEEGRGAGRTQPTLPSGAGGHHTALPRPARQDVASGIEILHITPPKAEQPSSNQLVTSRYSWTRPRPNTGVSGGKAGYRHSCGDTFDARDAQKKESRRENRDKRPRSRSVDVSGFVETAKSSISAIISDSQSSYHKRKAEFTGWTNFLYVFGGDDLRNGRYTVERYDINAGFWEKIGNGMPHFTESFAVAVHNDRIWLVGGESRNGEDRTAINVTVSTDESVYGWEYEKSLIQARASLGLIEFEDVLYAIGGRNGSSALNTTEVYNSQILEWVAGSDLNHARYDFGISTSEGRIYVAGGCISGTALHSVEVLTSETHQWTLMQNSMTSRRMFLGLGTVNWMWKSMLHAAGGDSVRSLEYYCTTTNKWRPMVIDEPEWMHQYQPEATAVACDERGFFFVGGFQDESTTMTSLKKGRVVYHFGATSKKWSRLPEMLECRSGARALVKYHCKASTKSKQVTIVTAKKAVRCRDRSAPAASSRKRDTRRGQCISPKNGRIRSTKEDLSPATEDLDTDVRGESCAPSKIPQTGVAGVIERRVAARAESGGPTKIPSSEKGARPKSSTQPLQYICPREWCAQVCTSPILHRRDTSVLLQNYTPSTQSTKKTSASVPRFSVSTSSGESSGPRHRRKPLSQTKRQTNRSSPKGGHRSPSSEESHRGRKKISVPTPKGKITQSASASSDLSTETEFYTNTSRAMGNFLYVFGGSNSLYRRGTIERYHFTSEKWEKVDALMPHHGVGCAIVLFQRRPWIIGGASLPDPSSYLILTSPLRDVFSFDQNTDEWHREKPMQRARTSLGAAVLDNRLFAVGGKINDKAVNRVEIYSDEKGWLLGPSLNIERYDFGIAEHGGAIYVAGGDNGGAILLNSVEMYAIGSGVWTHSRPLRIRQKSLQLISTGAMFNSSKLYVFGNASPDVFTSRTVEQVSEYNAERDRVGLAAAAHGKYIYVFGGYCAKDISTATVKTKSKSVNVYDIMKEKWLRIEDMIEARGGFHALPLTDCKFYR